jgi:lysophospholipid acyltransferase (LPLAT)-like uncharacterized protein
LRSWDAFLIPWPLSRGRFAYGEPLRVPRSAAEAEREQARRRLEEALQRLSAEVGDSPEWKS